MLHRAIAHVLELTKNASTKTNFSVLSTNFSDSNFSSLEWLFHEAPCFPVNSNRITIMKSPQDFYNALVDKSNRAKRRITFASLYLGTGSLEKNLLKSIESNKHLANGELKVNILLDFSRGSRGEVNSRTLILPLIQKYRNFVHLSLYHTPALRGIYKTVLPQRWNELIGLQHMKLYIFDDTLIISGANLSNDYFTNRQDRYFIIEDKRLVDFYDQLIACVQEFSLIVDDKNNVSKSSKFSQLPYEGNRDKFIDEAKRKITSFLKVYQNKCQANDLTSDTIIFPLVEMGQLNIHNDSIVTRKFFSTTVPNSTIYLATGYFNLTQDYMKTLIEKCAANCKVLMAHPDANGFKGAKFPAGGIPAAYTLLARKFQRKFKKKKDNIYLYEFFKPGWTYHAKGLWYCFPDFSYPILTFIGSPNFGARSVKRDLETQIIILTKNVELSKKLHDECMGLYKYGLDAETSRSVPYWVHTVVYFFKNFF